MNSPVDPVSLHKESSKCSETLSGIINLNIKKFTHVASSNRNTPVQNSRNHLDVTGLFLQKHQAKRQQSPRNFTAYPAIFEPNMFSKSVSPLMYDFQTDNTHNSALNKSSLAIPKITINGLCINNNTKNTKSRNPTLLPFSKSTKNRYHKTTIGIKED